MGSKITKYKNSILYFYTFVLLSINSIRIFNDSIWGDEGFSIRLAKGGIGYLVERTARDVHPPLYYIILKFFYELFGTSAMIGKLASFFPIVVFCIIAVTYFRKKFGTKAAMILVGAVTFTGNNVPMIVEIRMYTWGLLFIFVNLICIYEILEKESENKALGYWIGHCLVSLMAAYTHYYALITVAIMDFLLYVILFLRDKKTWKKSVLSMLAMIAGYFPWLIILLEQLKRTSESFWIEGVDIVSHVLYLFGDDKWGLLLFLILISSVIYFCFAKDILMNRKKSREQSAEEDIKGDSKIPCSTNEQKTVLICMVATFGTIFVGVALSLLIRPLYINRYIHHALGLVAVALAVSFVRSFQNRIVFVLLIFIMLASGSGEFSEIYRVESTYLTEETKQYMWENLTKEDVILTDNVLLEWTVLEYYFPDMDAYYSETTDIKDIDNSRVWLMLEKDKNLLKKCEEAGYSIKQQKDLGIDFVFFTLYLLEK